jgi:hypothetical protein
VIRDPVWWWVGWVERRGRVEACFALNFAPHGANRFADRFDIGRAILVEAGALPRPPPPLGTRYVRLPCNVSLNEFRRA